jgi:hypothetical protein
MPPRPRLSCSTADRRSSPRSPNRSASLARSGVRRDLPGRLLTPIWSAEICLENSAAGESCSFILGPAFRPNPATGCPPHELPTGSKSGCHLGFHRAPENSR